MNSLENFLSKQISDDYEEFIYTEKNESGEVISLEIHDADYFEFPTNRNLKLILSQFKSLQRLEIELSQYLIEDLSFLNNLSKLEYVSIECQTIIESLDFLSNLSELKNLRIQSSLLSNINCLSKNEKLEYIGLPNSKIEDISVLSNFRNLKTVDFSNNLIESIRALNHNDKLANVYLSNNNIAILKCLMVVDP